MSSTESAAGEGAGYVGSTLRHSSIYFVGLVAYRLVSFLMLPLYTRFLTPADYGALEMLGQFSDIVAMIAGMGIGSAVLRFYYVDTTPAHRAAVVSTGLSLNLGLFSIVAAVGMLLAPILTPALLGPGGSPTLVRLALIVLVLGCLVEVPLIVRRAEQRSVDVMSAGMVRALIGVAFNVLLLVWFRLGVQGVQLSAIIATGTVGGYLGWRMVREFGARFDAVLARKMLGYGAPLILWSLASFVLHYSDRFFLRSAAGLEDVGLYSLAYKIAMLIAMLVMSPFESTWTPKALEIDLREGPKAPMVLRSMLRLYNVVLVTVALGLSLFAGDVLSILVGPDFRSAGRDIPMLCLAMVFFGWRPISQLGALIRQRSGVIAWTTVLAAVVALCANVVLIPRWGTHGAAAATALAFLVEFIVLYRASERLYPIRMPVAWVAGPPALAAVCWGGATLGTPDATPAPYGFAIRCAAFALYAASIWYTGLLSHEERRQIRLAIRHPGQSLQRLRRA